MTYLDIIARNYTSFLRTRSILICFSLILIIIICIMERNEHHTSADYARMDVIAKTVAVSTMSGKPGATFNFQKQVR